MPRTTLKQQLEQRIGKPFRSIILENLQLGTGRYEAARILEDLCQRHRGPDQEHIKVLHSTLWYAIKKAIEAGELCEVEGDPDSNPLFYFNHGKVRHVTVLNFEQKMLEIDCEWECTECGRVWHTVKKTESLDMMTLRSQSCSECAKKGINTFGKVILRFEHEGISAVKAVVDIDGKPRESFVDDMMNPIESPFVENTVSA